MTMTRFYPIQKDQSYYEHIHRYIMAKNIVRDKDILDISSGEGYGSNLLAEVAKTVVGCDIDEDAVEAAKNKYKRNNLEFKVMDCQNIIFPKDSFDCVTSFETIEHINYQDEFLKCVKRVLRSNGIFIVSTPDTMEYSIKRNYKNEEHIKEFTKSEFIAFLKKYFKNIIVLGQVFASGSLIRLENEGLNESDNCMQLTIEKSLPPMYLIALCTDSDYNFNFINEFFSDASANGEFERCKAGLHDLEQQINVAKVSMENLEQQVTNAQYSEENLKEQLKNAELGNKDLKEQLKNAELDNEDLKKQLANAAVGIDDLKEQLANSICESKDLKKQLANYTDENKNLKTQLVNAADGINDLKKQLADAAAGNEDLKKQLKSIAKNIN